MEDADGGEASNDSTIGAHVSANTRRRVGRARAQETLLISGLMGQLTRPYASLFDDKLANQLYSFDGQKGGAAWKHKIGNYFVSKCPATRILLKRFKRYEGEEITEAILREIATKQGNLMPLPLMGSLNRQLWGFLSNCVHSYADTVFRGAADPQGLEAWRFWLGTSSTATPSSWSTPGPR